MSEGAEAGCLKVCRASASCPVGWLDGSCGGLPRGTLLPAAVPAHLPLAVVRAFEADLASRAVYHDWCVDNGWPGRAAGLEAEAS